MGALRNAGYGRQDVTIAAARLEVLIKSGKIRTPEDVPPVLRGWLLVDKGKVTGVEQPPKISHSEMQAINRLGRDAFSGRLPKEEEKA